MRAGHGLRMITGQLELGLSGEIVAGVDRCSFSELWVYANVKRQLFIELLTYCRPMVQSIVTRY